MFPPPVAIETFRSVIMKNPPGPAQRRFANDNAMGKSLRLYPYQFLNNHVTFAYHVKDVMAWLYLYRITSEIYRFLPFLYKREVTEFIIYPGLVRPFVIPLRRCLMNIIDVISADKITVDVPFGVPPITLDAAG
jgi:hypothetical protein